MIVVKSLIIFMSLLIFTSCVTTESLKDLIKKPFQKTEEVSENDPKNVEILKKNVASKSKNESKEKKLIEEPKGKSNEGFCKELNQKFKVYGWHKIICNPDRWRVYDYSIEGNPLFYQEFGFENKDKSLPINLFFCGVHGDETSAVHPCFHLVRELIFDNPEVLKRFKVVVAPLINPDGFFAKTRGNSRGVDPNRNLPTKDWEIAAKKVWGKYNYDPRKNPGDSPGSEVESKFQVFLINEYKPDKIISMHAPYGFIDFDGPGDRRYYNLIRIEQRAKFLALNIEANSKKFLKVVDYRFFPGSLGNYAGNERKIPTYTLELPSVSYLKAPYYWNILSFALIKALEFKVYDENETNPFLQMEPILSDVEKKD